MSSGQKVVTCVKGMSTLGPRSFRCGNRQRISSCWDVPHINTHSPSPIPSSLDLPCTGKWQAGVFAQSAIDKARYERYVVCLPLLRAYFAHRMLLGFFSLSESARTVVRLFAFHYACGANFLFPPLPRPLQHTPTHTLPVLLAWNIYIYISFFYLSFPCDIVGTTFVTTTVAASGGLDPARGFHGNFCEESEKDHPAPPPPCARRYPRMHGLIRARFPSISQAPRPSPSLWRRPAARTPRVGCTATLERSRCWRTSSQSTIQATRLA